MASLLDLADARLRGLLDIPTRAARAVVNPTLFSGLLGAPTLPKEQGFAEAAFGLPAQTEMSVLDPNQAAYMQGYSQGEPLAYLGMATPFAAPAAVAGAKAVAPKAGMALENYMASQGLLQPLTAYHGTPHTIRGKFDISKVGTGEGAQAYGHGMYFAESPSVAETYKRKLSGGLGSQSNELLINGQPLQNLSEAQRRAYEIVARDGRKNALGTAKDLEAEGFDASHIREALAATKGKEISLVKNEGNLYKVDIPDEYIPNMLDWDKPVPEELRKRVSKAAMDQFGSGATGTSGERLYKEIVFEMRRAGSKNPEADASMWLNQQGIKGIRYEDAGSRGKEGKTTSNFVVFDPTDVKILERNNKKLEGLLD